MIKGDISNEVPPRIIVTLDAVSKVEIEEKKALGGLRTKTVELFSWNMAVLSLLWDFSNRVGVTYELCAFGVEDEWLEKKMTHLDNRGTNPFNYCVAYESIEQLISELPFRGNVRSVIDVPERTARYGTWGMELEQLERGR